ncbi:1-deoxy-D-xylulose-5-phosphate reductoisomerase [bacterium]|jgi:1-deoxy-D-xylulose-5-phosphate reductoisomerase|nr:1-deoxy-D-xylulose-5-phosphate reductoisomerase [bacterium]MDF1790019.1 1-deoxy-D-xylulose-5-phosphate reductoisomerase [Verrucomicrobiales bacterium]
MSLRKKVVLLGSTGSIGTSTLKVARDIPDRIELIALAANRSVDALVTQVEENQVRHVALWKEKAAEIAATRLDSGVTIHSGEQGLIELAQLPEADMVIIAIIGTAGLRPALAAIEAGKDIAVASKEILVMAGQAVMNAAEKHGVNVLPIDSEHNAIYQCLEANRDRAEVSRLILTASGGPFRQLPAGQLAEVTLEQALKHPTWDMGAKITIDSATLFNKGLEMIEARWLFQIPMPQVDVIVHPQSIVHSMVEFVDGSILAQLSHSDMCFPIQYAVTWPERVANSLEPLDFAKLKQLDFEAPRIDDFPALRLAREAGEAGGTLPAVLNAANEVAVDAFRNRKLSFPGIWQTVESAMGEHNAITDASLEQIIEADAWAREVSLAKINGSSQAHS